MVFKYVRTLCTPSPWKSSFGKLFFLRKRSLFYSKINTTLTHCADKMQGFIMLKQVVRIATTTAEMLLK
jgi:hypothetical protein